MASDNKDSSQPPIGGITVLLLLAAGIFVGHQRPFQSSRPGDGNIKLEQIRELQDIDARLWEDPYVAVSRRQGEGSPATGAGKERDILPDLKKFVEREKQNLRIVGAMVYGGPYADDVEFRRRTRYAVISGLDASGYAPVWGDKIGSFRTESLGVKGVQVPQIVPFEIFEEREDRGQGKVLLLWLAEERFFDAPTRGLVSLLEKLGVQHRSDTGKTGKKIPDISVVGPANSTTLKYLIAEAMSGCEKHAGDIGKWGVDTKGLGIAFYSPGATAIAEDLLPRWSLCFGAINQAAGSGAANSSRPSEDILWELFHKGNVSMLRTINNDDEVARALVEELALRGIVPAPGKPDQVVLVSEWDTDYGRKLPERFIAAVCELDEEARQGGTDVRARTKAVKAACLAPEKRNPEWAVRASYLRGLDGGVPSDTAKRAVRGKQGKDTEDKDKSKEGPKVAELMEHAEGNGQYDYLRRLARVVQEQTITPNGKKRVAAVGVLGSDLYDKLLVLQALRQQFPGALFFTTDLDARLTHPDQYEWARNLLIGSGHGLKLREAIQGHTPPFRDTYQTATFLATRLALDETLNIKQKRANLDRWLLAPRVYEIGRTDAFAFQPKAEKKDAQASQAGECTRLEQCPDIRPPLPFFGPDSRLAVQISLWALSFATAGYLLRIFVWPVRRLTDYLWQGLLKRCWAKFVLLGMAAAVAWIAAAAASDTRGEPFAWIEGISIWPTELIRVVALVLMLYFIVRAYRKIDLEPDRPGGSFFKEGGQGTVWHGSFKIAKWYEHYKAGTPVKAGDIWAEFRVLESFRPRFWRIAIPFFLYVVLIVCVQSALGETPSAPYRGELARTVNTVMIWICGFTFIWLLSLVCDVIRLGAALIHILASGRSTYPQETVDRLRTELNFSAQGPDEALCDLLDIRLIGTYTEQVNSVVYYPFIILALMLIARSSLFDNWSIPSTLVVSVLLTVSIGVTCAVVLQRAARRARETSVERMNAHIIRARGGPQPYVAQLEMMLDEIKSLRRGAFVPFFQQPFVKAFLYPAGSFGGIQLLEYSLLGMAF